MAKRSTKDERRDEILESTWRLIARDGLAATNMRALAAEAGYANGALAYYFAGKDELLRAVYEHVSKQTLRRIEQAATGLRGMAALRAFCAEIVPDDELKLLEARVLVPFWSTALVEQDFAELFARDMAAWRRQLGGYLRQAVAAREIPPPVEAGGSAREQNKGEREHARVIEERLALLNGMQVLAVLTPKQHSARVMRTMLDGFLHQLGEPRALSALPAPATR